MGATVSAPACQLFCEGGPEDRSIETELAPDTSSLAVTPAELEARQDAADNCGAMNSLDSYVSTSKEGVLDTALRDLEKATEVAISRYRRAMRHPQADAEAKERASDIVRRLQLNLRRATLHKVASWRGDEAEHWLGMHTGGQRRFKNLRGVVRQVQLEGRIIKRWTRQCVDPTGRRSAAALHRQVQIDIDSWEGPDVFQLEEVSKQPLTQVFMAIWSGRRLDHLSYAGDEAVVRFLLALEAAYQANPYHNRMHAAEVTLAAYYFWARLAVQEGMHGFYSEADLLVVLVAAAIHDVGHPGLSNEFLVKTQHSLALQYSDRSVLEQYHAATAFALMKETGVSLLDHKLVSPPSSALKARVVDTVLSTDMARHKQVIDAMAAEVRNRSTPQDMDKLVVEKHLVHMADLGHALRPMEAHHRWSSLVREEFLAQGDRERELGLQPGPLFDREKAPTLAKGQTGFLNFVVIPTWKPLAQALGNGARSPDKCLRDNLAAWEQLAKQEELEAEQRRKPASPCRSRRQITTRF